MSVIENDELALQFKSLNYTLWYNVAMCALCYQMCKIISAYAVKTLCHYCAGCSVGLIKCHVE